MSVSPLLITLDEFVGLCIQKATYDGIDENHWSVLRRELMNDKSIVSDLPDFTHRYTNAGAFRTAMQRLGGYAARKEHILNGFNPLIARLENSSGHPMKRDAEAILQTVKCHQHKTGGLQLEARFSPRPRRIWLSDRSLLCRRTRRSRENLRKGFRH